MGTSSRSDPPCLFVRVATSTISTWIAARSVGQHRATTNVGYRTTLVRPRRSAAKLHLVQACSTSNEVADEDKQRVVSDAPGTGSAVGTGGGGRDGGEVKAPRVCIDYCRGCRWGLRAGWMAQEVLATFEGMVGEVALRPSDHGGTFDIWVDGELIWSRRDAGCFPELKVIKQRIRDVIAPDKSLGHSDVPAQV